MAVENGIPADVREPYGASIMLRDPYAHNWDDDDKCRVCGQKNWISETYRCDACFNERSGFCNAHLMQPCTAESRRQKRMSAGVKRARNRGE